MRLEGWRNPYEIPPPFVFSGVLSDDEWIRIYNRERMLVEKHDAYEAGADAYEKGLMKDGVYDIIKFTDRDVIIKFKTIMEHTYKRGTWVFIPEKEL